MINWSSFAAGVLVGGGTALMISSHSNDPTLDVLEESDLQAQSSMSEEGLGPTMTEHLRYEMIRDGSRSAL